MTRVKDRDPEFEKILDYTTLHPSLELIRRVTDDILIAHV